MQAADWIEEKTAELEKELKELNGKVLNISNVRGLSFVALLFGLILSYRYAFRPLFLLPSALILLAFFALVLFHRKKWRDLEQGKRLLEVLGAYRRKRQLIFSAEDFDGRAFYREEGEDKRTRKYLEDLHIIGENSLYQFLDVSLTGGGRQRLFEVLAPPSLDENMEKEIALRQASIEELVSKLPFVLGFQEKMKAMKGLSDRCFSQSFLKSTEDNRKKSSVFFILSLLFSLLTLSSFVLALSGALSFLPFNVMLPWQILFSFAVNKVFQEEFYAISFDVSPVSRWKELFQFVGETDFDSEKNRFLKEEIALGMEAIKELSLLDALDSFRKNIFSYLVFNIFFGINALIVHRYYRVVKKERESIVRSLRAIEEFEMLLSLASLPLLKENTCKPVIEKGILLDCEQLLYPLIEEGVCVSNDFRCANELNIITGSNMSGKTSFMRSIGVNLVLAYAGTFVNARKFRISLLYPFTSINVKDDISRGISTFYGELLRIKDIMDFSARSGKPMIVFIDEIFKGTNYADRIYGAKKVLERLSKLDCIVFLSTHDFELCELAGAKIKNYHFSEEYLDGKMFFSHKIKDGSSQSTNAKELMRELGIV